ncbi:MAG: hypothetical protein OEV78_13115 [Spirochaetia bacterium]|nr:hypothetical protein [Spirochaetia bacterium]
MDIWPAEQWSLYPHPGNRGNKIKTIAKLEKLPKGKRIAFEAKLAQLKAYCKQEKSWYHAPMMQTFMNNWEGLEYDVKAKPQHVEPRSTVKEYVKPPEKEFDMDAYLKQRGYTR